MVVCPRLAWMTWAVTPPADRRGTAGTLDHGRADASAHRWGGPTPTGGDEGGVPSGGLDLLARPRAAAPAHPPALPVTEAARPHRGPPGAAAVGLTVQRVGLRPSPRATPP